VGEPCGLPRLTRRDSVPEVRNIPGHRAHPPRNLDRALGGTEPRIPTPYYGTAPGASIPQRRARVAPTWCNQVRIQQRRFSAPRTGFRFGPGPAMNARGAACRTRSATRPMAAEAIHLTALEEAAFGASDPLPGEVLGFVRRTRGPARVGALLADLANFDHPIHALRPFGLWRGFSRWGRTLQRRGSNDLLDALLARIRRGAAAYERGGPGTEEALAFALGYATHLVVHDVSHPLVEPAAQARARLLQTSESVEHQRIDTLQWAIFQSRYHGADRLGTPGLFDELNVPGEALLADDRWWRLLYSASQEAFGHAPERTRMLAWMRGYRRYVRLLASPLGKLVATPQAREEAYDVLYARPDFHFDDVFAIARQRSRHVIETAFACGRGYLDPAALHACFDPPAR
jgi:hypothetical protein